MKTFYATRDRMGCCLWGVEPIFLEHSNIYGGVEDKVFCDREEDFKRHFGLTLAMNECKRVKIRLEVV